MVPEQLVDAIGPAAWKLTCARLFVSRIVEALRLFRCFEQFLAEQCHFLLRCALLKAIRSASVRTPSGAGLLLRYFAMSALSSVQQDDRSFLPITESSNFLMSTRSRHAAQDRRARSRTPHSSRSPTRTA